VALAEQARQTPTPAHQSREEAVVVAARTAAELPVPVGLVAVALARTVPRHRQPPQRILEVAAVDVAQTLPVAHLALEALADRVLLS
jgi:hypothetical protein